MAENRKIDNLQNLYPITKTIVNKLIPQGATLRNFENNHLLENDTERKDNYQIVKKLIDEYHKFFIEQSLSNVTYIDGLDEYIDVYFNSSDDKDELDSLEDKLRKNIANLFTKSSKYSDMFKKEMITKLLPEFLEATNNLEYLDIVNSFAKFTTYFTGFFDNRKNMYTSEAQSTGIAYRCINDNLPKFLDNVKSFIRAKDKLPEKNLTDLNNDFEGLCGTTTENVFSADYYVFVLAQSGIDRYNEIIGGYTTSDGTKIKGVNEYINLYNQRCQNKSDRIPNMKPLFKQILSDRQTVSFIPDSFSDDNEVLKAVYSAYNDNDTELEYKSIKETVDKIKNLFIDFEEPQLNGIYIKNGLPVTDLSNGIFKNWSIIRNLWNDDYDSKHKPAKVKDIEKYEDKRSSQYKSNKSLSLGFLQELVNKSENDEISSKSISEYYREKTLELTENIQQTYFKAESLLESKYDIKKKNLKNDEESIALIKDFLDSIKELEKLLKPLCGTGKEQDKNEVFYGEFIPLFNYLCNIDSLYNKVRNYVTQKPYSTEKIKLNFENPQFLGGWDRNKEKDYRSVLLIKDQEYYLGVMNKGDGKIFENLSFDGEKECYTKVVCKLLPGPNKMLPKVFFAKSNIDFFAPSDEIQTLYKAGTFKKGKSFNIDDCHKLIDFYKQSLCKHPDWSTFNFKFRETSLYNDISEFYNDIHNQGYKISFDSVPESYINELVNKGKLYLFKIYNKDFSKYSKGTPNLHTLYFKMLFDERNLKDVVYQLNGGAEMFYRPASIMENDIISHPANQPIKNKNPHSEKTHSTFEYDLIKDKRYTKAQFSLHTPITLNFKASGVGSINDKVNELLKNCDDNYVIGIDRGERHLLYLTVINGRGEVVEQYSLNTIINEYNNKTHKVDYHNLLNEKETKRKEARQNWTAIENIKELKEGYISQVVHKICELVVKYDAVICMEDLNAGFKQGRTKFEKQVYQKFEKMLIDKLNFFVDKKKAPEENGGLLKAYQLTNKFDSFKKMGRQNGIIFYVPAWLTSKIDPSTGFVDLLKPKYKSVEDSKNFFSRFDSIRYNSDEDWFEFEFDYDNFPRGSASFRKRWTVCTFGKRIRTYRNPEKNSEWDNEEIDITVSFKELFNNYSIDYIRNNLKTEIQNQTQKDFFQKLIKLFALTVQMRNSITNTDIDYLISPVMDKNGNFYDSRNYDNDSKLPANADANGAYNIARKGLWAIEQIKNTDDGKRPKLAISNKEWLKLAQSADM